MAEPVSEERIQHEFAPQAEVEVAARAMESFARSHGSQGHRVVLITSGGTKVPLESRTVRFLDNFSSGRRGAASAEYFLKAGYAVIFLHRHRSMYPYSRRYTAVNWLDALHLLPAPAEHSCPGHAPAEHSKSDSAHAQPAFRVEADPSHLQGIVQVLQDYHSMTDSGMLLPVEFNTLSDYLHLLLAAAKALSPLGSNAMFYLAAAVSDFYIPASEMPEHKIQSSSGPLQITMKMVPKMLSPLVKDWAPKAFVVSFKLETDTFILLERAHKALSTYRHQAVVANVLDTLRSSVVIVTNTAETKLTVSKEEDRLGVEIEEKIISDLTSRHTSFREGLNSMS
ncbi:phosphopantothenate--cysteine ligase [Pelobates fuscus]|uniref:phosphopantothenate--cysteine ligase n=1 Tax=Pelobates fuscus TaxID=191477 RepID=UPI002FE47FF7